jgi:hypothetical protein
MKHCMEDDVCEFELTLLSSKIGQLWISEL